MYLLPCHGHRTVQGHLAEDYDELVDNPVAVAKAPSYRFSVKDQDYILLNVGENKFWDGEQAAQDVRKNCC